jgi:hypothetical protein
MHPAKEADEKKLLVIESDSYTGDSAAIPLFHYSPPAGWRAGMCEAKAQAL